MKVESKGGVCGTRAGEDRSPPRAKALRRLLTSRVPASPRNSFSGILHTCSPPIINLTELNLAGNMIMAKGAVALAWVLGTMVNMTARGPSHRGTALSQGARAHVACEGPPQCPRWAHRGCARARARCVPKVYFTYQNTKVGRFERRRTAAQVGYVTARPLIQGESLLDWVGRRQGGNETHLGGEVAEEVGIEVSKAREGVGDQRRVERGEPRGDACCHD